MDKQDYLELLQMSRRATRPEEGSTWIGSHDLQAPPPFGEKSNSYIRRYNRQWLKDRFEKPGLRSKKQKRRRMVLSPILSSTPLSSDHFNGI